VHTPYSASYVKPKVTGGSFCSPDWIKRDLRARRALAKSKVPPEARAVFDFMATLQGRKQYAFPSTRMLIHAFGSQGKANRWIELAEEALPEVFSVVRVGKNSGRKTNLYKCVEYCDWPEELVQRLEKSKLPKPTRKTLADKQHERMVTLVSKLGTISKMDNVDAKRTPFQISYLGDNANGIIPAQRREGMCDVCDKPVLGAGYQFRGSLICMKDGPCHQEALEAIEIPF